ncbi:MAG: hypothetical protein WDM90_07030 [Ferruginibacter sp.]
MTAIDAMAVMYADLLNELISNIQKDEPIQTYEQNENDASYSLWRNEDDYLIDWNQDAVFIKRFIDAVGNPYKGACFHYNGKRISIVDAEIFRDVKIVNRDTGKVLTKNINNPVVVCGTGLLEIKKMLDEDNNEFILDSLRVRLNK